MRVLLAGYRPLIVDVPLPSNQGMCWGIVALLGFIPALFALTMSPLRLSVDTEQHYIINE